MAAKHTTTQTDWHRIGYTMRKWYGSVLLLPAVWLLLPACKTVRVKDAEWAHQAGRYAQAADLYDKLYRRTPRKEPEKKAYFAFKAGENYRLARNVQRAQSAYLSARNYHYPDTILALRIAQMQQIIAKNKNFGKDFQEYLTLVPNDFFASLGVQSADRQSTLKSNPFRFHLRPAKELSSSRSDFGGCFTPDGKAFYFSSARNRDPEVENSLITGEKPNDLYYTAQDAQGKWSKVDSVAGGINTPADEGMPCITPDGSQLYYTYAESDDLYDRTAKIYRSSKSGEGGWSAGTEVKIWSDSLKMAAHPTVSSDGKTLFFVSEGGYGGKDIYSIAIEEIGTSTPTNIGAAINTKGNEISPVMVGDSTLYFASDGHVGLGGYDLYKAQLTSSGSWQVSHLGAPINSPQDDYGIVFNPTPGKEFSAEGYLSSSRSDARGYPHLFSFKQYAIRTTLEGFVFDREENPIQGAIIHLVSEHNPEDQIITSSKEDGYYSIDLEGGTHYVVLAEAENYLNRYSEFKTDPATEDATYQIDFQLASRIRSEVFQDVYYEFDQATLKDESINDLETMVGILKDNPEVRVEISSHADRKGSDAYNLALSNRRAQSVIDYLSTHGIALERLQSKGYGKSRPRVITSRLHQLYPQLQEGTTLDEEFILQQSEEIQALCDQLNRRTEFTVLE